LRGSANSEDDPTAKELWEVVKKLFIMHSPWRDWRFSGRWIVAASNNLPDDVISASDSVGIEVLSYVTKNVQKAFFTSSESYVSSLNTYSTLNNHLNNPQFNKTTRNIRGSHILNLRWSGVLIFGTEFKQEWFASKFDRGSITKLQELLGANPVNGGKTYSIFPPILFPEGSTRNQDIFLNPALAKVCLFH
jgi:hypothetical protein